MVRLAGGVRKALIGREVGHNLLNIVELENEMKNSLGIFGVVVKRANIDHGIRNMH